MINTNISFSFLHSNEWKVRSKFHLTDLTLSSMKPRWPLVEVSTLTWDIWWTLTSNRDWNFFLFTKGSLFSKLLISDRVCWCSHTVLCFSLWTRPECEEEEDSASFLFTGWHTYIYQTCSDFYASKLLRSILSFGTESLKLDQLHRVHALADSQTCLTF